MDQDVKGPLTQSAFVNDGYRDRALGGESPEEDADDVRTGSRLVADPFRVVPFDFKLSENGLNPTGHL
jgi:hypothetical protein